MNLILIVLCGILMGALNFGFFILGFYVRSKRPEETKTELNADNMNAIKDLFKWMNY